MRSYCYLFLLILFSTHAQLRKPHLLKKGEIVFRQATVVDTVKFLESVEKLRPSLIRSAIAEGLADSLAVSAVNNVPLADLYLNGLDTETVHHMYRDSIIIAFRKDMQGLVRGDYAIIDVARKNYYMLAKADSVTVYQKNTPYGYDNYTEIREFREQKKTINGYSCFKVTAREVDYAAGAMFPGAAAAETLWELWVTTELRSSFHPIIRCQTVLDRYYPLYISSTSTLVEGVKTIAEVCNIKIK